MKRFAALIPVLFLITSCASLSPEVRLPAAFPLPSVHEPMETAEFWINRLAEPDRVLMTGSEIEEFNRKNTRADVYITDILDYPATLTKKEVREMIVPLTDWAREHVRYGHDNLPVGAGFIADIEKNIGLDSLPDTVRVRFGMITEAADLRVIPTAEIGMEDEDAYEFDMLQASLLSPGTPVAVVSDTADLRWFFVVTPYTSGWVEAESVGIASSRGEIWRYLDAKPFIVVTGPEVDVFSDREMNRHGGTLRLGCRAPLVGRSGDAFVVVVVGRAFDGTLIFPRGFVAADGPVHEGYLPYSGKNVITVAFSMKDRRYGWGGMCGYWDCSSYVRDVFSVFGIVLPRNSTSQGKAGAPVGHFEAKAAPADKYAMLDTALPGFSLLLLPGHVMIYLGEYGGRYYAVHDLWAYRTRGDLGRRELFGVGRVAVSDLTLGKGGIRGSLIERITDIVEIR